MRTSFLTPFLLLIIAAALYMLPDGSFYSWRLSIRGAVARLWRPPDPRQDAAEKTFSDSRDLLILLHQKEAHIADLRRRLAEIGVTKEKVDKVTIIPGRVMRLGPDNTLDTFTVDVGTVDGVKQGMAVVVGEALAGVIVKAEAEASLALSLSSPGCYLSARLGEPGGSVDRPRLLCAVRGLGVGKIAAVVFTSATAAKEGWLAMTSGLEGPIPEGLLIGTLAGMLTDGEENGTLEAELRPVADLTSLDFVTVLGKD